MSTITDPARKFVMMCKRLQGPSADPGVNFLGEQFGAEPWSTDWMLILASIHQQISTLGEMINGADLDDDIKEMARGCLEGARHAFSANGLQNAWANFGAKSLSDTTLNPVLVASGSLRPIYGFHKPDWVESEPDKFDSMT